MKWCVSICTKALLQRAILRDSVRFLSDFPHFPVDLCIFGWLCAQQARVQSANSALMMFSKLDILKRETHFLSLMVLTRLGAAPVKPALVKNFLENIREFSEIVTSTGAKSGGKFSGSAH